MLKMSFLVLAETVWSLGPKHGENETPNASWKLFGRTEMPKMSIQKLPDSRWAEMTVNSVETCLPRLF